MGRLCLQRGRGRKRVDFLHRRAFRGLDYRVRPDAGNDQRHDGGSHDVKVIIGDMMYSPGSGTLVQAQTQRAGNTDAYNALKAGMFADRVFRGADLLAAFGDDPAGSGYMQSDLIHLLGVPSRDIQGPAYADSLKAVLPQRAVI